MAATVSFRRVGGWTQTGSNGNRASGRFGSSPQTGQLLWESGQVDTIYRNAFSIGAGLNLDVDLRGGTGELDINDKALSLQRVRWVYCEITSPGTGVSIRLGPQGVTNAWQAWFQAATANFWETVAAYLDKADAADLWSAVGASTSVLRLNNPSAGTVAGVLLVGGLHT